MSQCNLRDMRSNGWVQFFTKWTYHFFVDGIAFSIFGLWAVIAIYEPAWVPAFLIIALVASYQASSDITKEYKKKCEEEAERREQAQRETEIWKRSLIEKSAGFTTLLQAIDYYEKIKDEKVEQFLRYKKHPSIKGAEAVRKEAQRRRIAEFQNRKTQAILQYYESIAPFLLDFKEDVTAIEDEGKDREYDEEERADPATQYLAKEEFRKPSSIERNQRALDRFWARPKSQ